MPDPWITDMAFQSSHMSSMSSIFLAFLQKDFSLSSVVNKVLVSLARNHMAWHPLGSVRCWWWSERFLRHFGGWGIFKWLYIYNYNIYIYMIIYHISYIYTIMMINHGIWGSSSSCWGYFHHFHFTDWWLQIGAIVHGRGRSRSITWEWDVYVFCELCWVFLEMGFNDSSFAI
jgi:hypothetical protein